MNNESNFEFKVGDIVEWCGVRGVIGDSDTSQYPLKVEFQDGRSTIFTRDGKYLLWHKEPSLKLIERPKKKEKRVLKAWVNVYEEYHSIFSRKALADDLNQKNRLACVEINQEYEVEVEW